MGMSKYDNMMVIEGGGYAKIWRLMTIGGVGVRQTSKMYDVIYGSSLIRLTEKLLNEGLVNGHVFSPSTKQQQAYWPMLYHWFIEKFSPRTVPANKVLFSWTILSYNLFLNVNMP